MRYPITIPAAVAIAVLAGTPLGARAQNAPEPAELPEPAEPPSPADLPSVLAEARKAAARARSLSASAARMRLRELDRVIESVRIPTPTDIPDLRGVPPIEQLSDVERALERVRRQGLAIARARPGRIPAPPAPVRPPVVGLEAYTPMPAPATHPQDPADSLYRAAREALNGGEYRSSATLFGRIPERFPRSEYAPDAFYWRAFALYRVGEDDHLRAALRALERQGERYPEAATRGDAEALAVRIRGALARRGDAEAAVEVAEAARAAAPASPEGEAANAQCPADEETEIRTAALNALLQMDGDRAVPILRQVLERRDACSAPLRRKAVFLVSQKETGAAEEILLRAARGDPDREVRRQAVFWLSEVPTDQAVDALEEVLRDSDDDELRERALFALSEHESERSGAILRRVARQMEAPDGVRERAIFWLGQQGSEANAEFLRTLFAEIESRELKEKVLFSLSEMDGRGNERWLLDVAVDGSQPVDVRKKALFWAGEAGAAIGEFVGLYDRSESRELKEQLLFVLSQHDGPEAVDELMDIARTESDPELRKRAIFWLGQSDDPRVAEFLTEIISS